MTWVCNPTASPLRQANDEAMDVSKHYPSVIHRGGTAQQLSQRLLEKPPRRFLFIGHADASAPGGPRTLGFTSEDGSAISIAPNDELARMFGEASAKANGGQLSNSSS